MRYAIISDIHSNLDALEAALKKLRAEKAEAYICLGDIVGYGPNPNECMQIIRELPGLICIAGNHDLAAVGKYDISTFNPFAKEAIVWTAAQLQPEHTKFLVSLPLIQPLDLLTLVHGALPEPMDYILSVGDARNTFAELTTPVCLIGHTHMTEYYCRQTDAAQQSINQVPLFSGGELHIEDDLRYIINPGSIGQPRDGNPKCSFGLWNDEMKIITIYRAAYNIKKTQKKMLEAGLPGYLADRLAAGR